MARSLCTLKRKLHFARLQLTRKGSTIDPQLLQAIRDFPTPTNRTDIKSFFGLINQLSPFTDKIAEVSKPLRPLLKQSVQFQWNTSHQESFDQARHALATDASRLKGLGFILRQQSQDGSWRVTQAGSRFLSNAETRYAMIELELLAISWAAHKCRLFLEGLPQFEIITDHRPLVPILNDYSLDQIENPRLQRLRMKLDRYNYNCTWIRGKDHLAADALSRAPVQHATSEDELDEIDDHKHATVSALGATNIDARMEEVKTAAANDDDYQHLKSTILAGFPNERANLSPRLRPYWNMRDRLAVDDDFIVCGKRTVIPNALRKTMLERLKNGHWEAPRQKNVLVK